MVLKVLCGKSINSLREKTKKKKAERGELKYLRHGKKVSGSQPVHQKVIIKCFKRKCKDSSFIKIMKPKRAKKKEDEEMIKTTTKTKTKTSTSTSYWI